MMKLCCGTMLKHLLTGYWLAEVSDLRCSVVNNEMIKSSILVSYRTDYFWAKTKSASETDKFVSWQTSI